MVHKWRMISSSCEWNWKLMDLFDCSLDFGIWKTSRFHRSSRMCARDDDAPCGILRSFQSLTERRECTHKKNTRKYARNSLETKTFILFLYCCFSSFFFLFFFPIERLLKKQFVLIRGISRTFSSPIHSLESLDTWKIFISKHFLKSKRWVCETTLGAKLMTRMSPMLFRFWKRRNINFGIDKFNDSLHPHPSIYLYRTDSCTCTIRTILFVKHTLRWEYVDSLTHFKQQQIFHQQRQSQRAECEWVHVQMISNLKAHGSEWKKTKKKFITLSPMLFYAIDNLKKGETKSFWDGKLLT